jgi:hypothetical protein
VTVGRLASLMLRARLRPKPKMLLPPPCIWRKLRLKIQSRNRIGIRVMPMLINAFQLD